MASLKSRSVKPTVATSRELPHIITDRLYPAWHSLLMENTAYKFTDSSASAHDINSLGGHHSSVNPKVGTTSMMFDGVADGTNTGDEINVTGHADFAFAGSPSSNTNDFCVEGWFYFSTFNSGGTGLWGYTSTGSISSTDAQLNLYLEGGAGTLTLRRNLTGSSVNIQWSWSVSLGTWYHVAIVRYGTSLKLYVNGTATSTDHNVSGVDLGRAASGSPFEIGTDAYSGRFMPGFVDEFRLVKGSAVYTGNFTAPTALTQTGGTYASGTNVNTSITSGHTKLLIHSAETTGVHIGAYGTAQADGHKYYYTDINGSKPIKDPRIGTHFGTHRHKTRSLQILEQETATNGTDVYSVDGREWMRCYGPTTVTNNLHGEFINVNGGQSGSGTIEIVAYCSGFNMCALVTTGEQNAPVYKIDGGGFSAELTQFTTSSAVLTGSRFKSRGTLMNLFKNQTLGIHTITIRASTTTDYISLYDIELTAQDKFTDATCDYNDDPTITHDANTRILAGMSVSGTGIPANATVASVTSTTVFELSVATTTGSVTNGTLTFAAENIQIPSQNVVSFGKKFTVSGTPHYDPFHGFVNDTTLFASVVDMETSLGLGTATTWGAAWDKGSDNHIRPYNGGRVVKWVDSAGTIKTSVNMMPPNAQNINTVAAAEISTPSATNTAYLPAFSDDGIDHSLAEVAKTIHYREFGNGAANGGTLSSNYPDASMVNATSDDIAYVMDDGLTSLSADDMEFKVSKDLGGAGPDDVIYITFIGTGIGKTTTVYGTNYTIAQNLPYGTHILAVLRQDDSGGDPDITIDGQPFTTNTNDYGYLNEVTFYQPKMPPIPEDAVIISDYMLMADYVGQTSAGYTNLSKGIRRQGVSSDLYMFRTDGVASFSFTHTPESPTGWQINMNSASSSTSVQYRLPCFATNFVERGVLLTSRSALTVDDVIQSGGAVTGTNTDNNGGYYRLVSSLPLGEYKIGVNNIASQAGNHICYDIATPTHTSSHYQTFESPFLQELVGGDRNMEQTNLVVTSDGKTWDEVTRDTSYIGKEVVHANFIGTSPGGSAEVIFDDHRGYAGTSSDKYDSYHTKDFAIGWNRFICLVPGNYSITAYTMDSAEHGVHNQILINGVVRMKGYCGTSSYSCTTPKLICDLQRGDYVQLKGSYRAELKRSDFFIERN